MLFNKEPSAIETINDIDGNVVNFFRVLREQPEALAERIALTPYARDVFDDAWADKGDTDFERAVRLAIAANMGFGCKLCSKPGFYIETAGEWKNSKLIGWDRKPEQILKAAGRLKQVQIENRPALDLIRRFNHESVLIYADPPYLPETQVDKKYANEMTEQDHLELLEALKQHKGYVILSGYASELYDRELQWWTRTTYRSRTRRLAPREEVLWCNFEVPELFKEEGEMQDAE